MIPGVSDGGAHTKFLTSGSYTTDTLAWLVRDEKRLTLEEAHYKLSYLPARAAGFRDRGALLEGWPADVVVYDLARLERLPELVGLRDRARLPRRRVAAHPARVGLPLHAGERRDHVRARASARARRPGGCCATARRDSRAGRALLGEMRSLRARDQSTATRRNHSQREKSVRLKVRVSALCDDRFNSAPGPQQNHWVAINCDLVGLL